MLKAARREQALGGAGERSRSADAAPVASAQATPGGRLTPSHQRLLLLIRTIGFGSIEGLRVAAGQPVFDPPPLVLREVRFEPRQQGRPRTADEITTADLMLLAELRRVDAGTIQRIDVRYGKPFRLLRSVEVPP